MIQLFLFAWLAGQAATVAHQFLGYALLAQGYAAETIPHLDRAGAQEALEIAQIETGQLTEAAANFTATACETSG